MWEFQIALLVGVVGVGALAEFVGKCPVRTEFGESGEEERRGRREKRKRRKSFRRGERGRDGCSPEIRGDILVVVGAGYLVVKSACL